MKRATREAERLRIEIGERASNRGRLPRAVRDRAKEFARGRVRAGVSTAMVAAELGLSVKTIERWLAGDSVAAHALVPVRVVSARPATTRNERVIVVTVGGMRIEGLDIDALCTLVSRYG